MEGERWRGRDGEMEGERGSATQLTNCKHAQINLPVAPMKANTAVVPTSKTADSKI